MYKVTAIAVILIIVVSVGSLPVMAADTEVSVPIPGSARYFLQRLVERVRLGLTRNPSARASLMARMIQRRAGEIEAMTPEQQSRFAPKLAGDMAGLTRAAERIMARMEKSAANMTQVAATVAESNDRALKVLQQLLADDNIPGQAHAALTETVRTLKRVRSRSSEILERIADGEMPGNGDRAREQIQSMRRARENLPASARGRQAPGGE